MSRKAIRARRILHTARCGSIQWAAAILFGVAALLASGCGSRPESPDLVARVGKRTITKTDLTAQAGMPYDSLAPGERLTLLEGAIQRAMVEQEGEQRGLEHHPAVESKLRAIRADLYLAELLAERPSPPPSDSAVMAYYEAHEREFLRAVDSYLIELYWGEDQGIMNRFRNRLQEGDTTLLTTGQVMAEGRWLTEEGELENDLERELSSLEPGEVTFARPYEDGFRVVRLVEVYPAGAVLDLSAVGEEIRARLTVEESRRRLDALFESLRGKYPVKLLVADTTAAADTSVVE